jgi:hypothetical protein
MGQLFAPVGGAPVPAVPLPAAPPPAALPVPAAPTPAPPLLAAPVPAAPLRPAVAPVPVPAVAIGPVPAVAPAGHAHGPTVPLGLQVADGATPPVQATVLQDITWFGVQGAAAPVPAVATGVGVVPLSLQATRQPNSTQRAHDFAPANRSTAIQRPLLTRNVRGHHYNGVTPLPS